MKKTLILAVLLFHFLIHSVAPAHSEPIEPWQWRNPLPHGYALSEVAYGNGVFVAVGAAGSILYSHDAIHWAAANSRTTDYFTLVSFGGGVFVAISSIRIHWSSDGINWSAASASPRGLSDLEYANNMFVAVGGHCAAGTACNNGYTAEIFTSPDGKNWTDANPTEKPEIEPLGNMSYGKGLFVATKGKIDQADTIFVSTNGTTWTKKDIGDLGVYPRGIAFGNDLFVMVASDAVLTSPDGIRWSKTPADLDMVIFDVHFANGMFYISGDDERFFVSANGLDWTNHPTDYLFYDIAFGNGTYVASGPYGILASSPDGASWTLRTQTVSTSELEGIAYGHGIYVAAGRDHTVLTSPDGIQWTPRTVGTSSIFYGARYLNGTFFLLGVLDIYLSQDGVGWTEVNLPSGSSSLAGITYGNGLYVAVGGSGTTYTSADGMAWTLNDIGSDWFKGVAFGNGVFVAVGSYKKVFTSIDGVNWTEKNVDASYLQDIVFANGKFVAVGWSASILTSSDGDMWTPAEKDRFTSTDFEAVAYGNGLFVAVSSDGDFATSADGGNWIVEYNNHPGLNAVAFGNNNFVAAGEGGTILQAGPACEGVLFSNYALHVPYIQYGATSLWADFALTPSGESLFFRITNFGIHEGTSPYVGCSGATLTGDMRLSTDLFFESIPLWVDMTYSGGLDFLVTGAGAR
jgi:hypothetical protein